jgi:enoyl-CoA hydratase/carnithine racemase
MTGTYETILYQVEDRVATITLNRPDRLNAFTTQMARDLVAVFSETDADDEVRAVIVTGAGRGFCAGADLESGGATFDHAREADNGAAAAGDTGARDTAARDTAARDTAARDTGGLVSLRIFRSLKPVIGAINGPAVGVGASMTLPMDVRLMADHTKMGFVFSARGIVPDAAASWFLPRVVGISQAAEWCLTGRVFPATEALAGGLVRSLHPAGELLDAAGALGREMATNVAPVSAVITRQLLWRMLGAAHPMDAHRVDSRAIAQTGSMADAVEGVTSFLEKRTPEWKLRPSQDTPDWYPWWEEPTYTR